MRRHYIDNLRWGAVLLLIPYHAAQAFNTWGEPNYISFEPSRVVSGLIVFTSPFFMPLLFMLAGISTALSLKKRSYRQYAAERVKRLFVPLVFGVTVLMPVMCWLADRYNHGYSGGFFSHCGKFFTTLTDWTGADGAFSLGQFWFLLYLFVISIVSLGVIAGLKRAGLSGAKRLPLWVILLLGAPLPLLSEVLSVGGKSAAEYLYIFLLGYYVFSDEGNVEALRRFRIPLTAVGAAAGAADVWLFQWCAEPHPGLNTAAKFICEWFMLLGLTGFGRARLDRTGKAAEFFSRLSFPYFTFHFIWVVVMQYLLSDLLGGNAVLLYTVPAVLAFVLTVLTGEAALKIPAAAFLIGCPKRR